LKLSVVELTEGPDIDVDVSQVLRTEEPDRIKNISRQTWDIIRAQKAIFE
jgi:hypothetical protein